MKNLGKSLKKRENQDLGPLGIIEWRGNYRKNALFGYFDFGDHIQISILRGHIVKSIFLQG